jgi:anti-sigma-K factor RskA
MGGLTSPQQEVPRLQKSPDLGVARRPQRRAGRRRALLLLAAALAIAAVFVSGFAVGDHRGGNAPTNSVAGTLALRGTSVAPHARARLEVLRARGGNWPITLSVVGLPKLPPDTYYEVDLVRSGRPPKSCGSFRVASASHAVTLTLNAPFALRKGDSWIVTRQVRGRESGVIALRPI